MTFITLPQSGAVIDLASVGYIVKTQSDDGNGIKIRIDGSELTFFGDDARRFLEQIRGLEHVNVEELLKHVRVTSKKLRA
jgi:hypothetical protein